jgi:hypothetical protein
MSINHNFPHHSIRWHCFTTVCGNRKRENGEDPTTTDDRLAQSRGASIIATEYLSPILPFYLCASLT